MRRARLPALLPLAPAITTCDLAQLRLVAVTIRAQFGLQLKCIWLALVEMIFRNHSTDHSHATKEACTIFSIDAVEREGACAHCFNTRSQLHTTMALQTRMSMPVFKASARPSRACTVVCNAGEYFGSVHLRY